MSSSSPMTAALHVWPSATLVAAGLRPAARPPATAATVAPLKAQLAAEIQHLDGRLDQITNTPAYRLQQADLAAKQSRLTTLQQLDPLRAHQASDETARLGR